MLRRGVSIITINKPKWTKELPCVKNMVTGGIHIYDDVLMVEK